MQSFDVKILKPKAADILYDLERKKFIRLTKKVAFVKKSRKKTGPRLLSQIEQGLKDVALIQSGKTKPKTLGEILNGK